MSDSIRADVLNTALALITEDRNNEYGDATRSFERIADLWTTYLGYPISAKDVAMMMVLLKVSRTAHLPTRDSFIDIAGYAALGAEVAL